MNIGLNKAVKFVPMFVKAAQNAQETWFREDEVEMCYQVSRLTFTIMTMILFGDDVHEKLGTIDVEHPDGKIHSMTFYDAYIKHLEMCEETTFNPINVLFPNILVDLNIGIDNRRNK